MRVAKTAKTKERAASRERARAGVEGSSSRQRSSPSWPSADRDRRRILLGQVERRTAGLGHPAHDAGDLLDRLSVAGAALLVATLDALEAGAVQPVEQPVEGVSYAPRIEVDDARVRWSDPAFAVDRRVRACTPSPGAWTTLSGDRLKLGPVTLRPDAEALPPGSVHVARTEVLVGTGTVPVALGEVRAAGRRPMPGTDWARGARLPAEVVLGG